MVVSPGRHECGEWNCIPRGGGLWEGHRVEKLPPEAWERNRELVTRFYNERRGLCGKPNRMRPQDMAKWQDHFHVQIITQSDDDLHEQAGSKHVCTEVQGTSCGPSERVYGLDHWEMQATDRCQRAIPNRLVWFGEAVPMMASLSDG